MGLNYLQEKRKVENLYQKIKSHNVQLYYINTKNGYAYQLTSDDYVVLFYSVEGLEKFINKKYGGQKWKF